jgi:hypothetical protein
VEFAVSDIRNIDWNPESFERLTVPDKQKELIRTVAASHVNRETCSFDDFVRGKGQGLLVLLQYACLAPPMSRYNSQPVVRQVLAKRLLRKGCRSTSRNRFTP